MAGRPDFSQKTKEVLTKRAGQKCSNPDCRRPTSGPHTDDAKAVNIGEAAHISGARSGAARYDADMTDEQRGDPSNGIWLCRTCAKLIDSDEEKYAAELLRRWKEDHESAVMDQERERAAPAKEVHVKGGGTGSIIQNTGDGVAEEIIHEGKGSAEKVTVDGQGVRQMLASTGTGTAKRLISKGGGALDASVNVTENVRMAYGMSASLVASTCSACGHNFTAQKVVLAFAGNEEPKQEVRCPRCGAPKLI